MILYFIQNTLVQVNVKFSYQLYSYIYIQYTVLVYFFDNESVKYVDSFTSNYISCDTFHFVVSPSREEDETVVNVIGTYP